MTVDVRPRRTETGVTETGVTETGVTETGVTETGRPRLRPGPVRWLWYAYGGGLPARYREWVLYDLTCRTWVPRHFARALVQVLPVVVALLIFVPGPPSVRVAAVVAGVLLGLLYSGAYLYEIAEHRVAKAGYPVGTAGQVREDADAEQRAERAARYASMWRADQ
jgi:hypothetical protein